jgi:hypothetical protein
MKMTLSEPHPEHPSEVPGKMLGADQFAASARWSERGQLALVGMGVERGDAVPFLDRLRERGEEWRIDDVDSIVPINRPGRGGVRT